VVMFGGILLSLQLLLDRMLAEKQAKEELAIANDRIRNYALNAEELATLQERNRIAREIHDSLGHSLTTLNLYLEMSLKLARIQPDRSFQSLTEAKRLGSIALQDVRQSVAALRSEPFQGQNLPIALHQLLDEFQQSNQIPCNCSLDLPPQLPSEIATAIYRIVQAALTNTSKYARATQVSIDTKFDTQYLYLAIDDDGCGFEPQHNQTGFGIQGMRERVLALQGRFEIISAPQRGCQICATIPLTT
jgi:signal transduction histidine kinase